jgi:hypothetical protein
MYSRDDIFERRRGALREAFALETARIVDNVRLRRAAAEV